MCNPNMCKLQKLSTLKNKLYGIWLLSSLGVAKTSSFVIVDLHMQMQAIILVLKQL